VRSSEANRYEIEMIAEPVSSFSSAQLDSSE